MILLKFDPDELASVSNAVQAYHVFGIGNGQAISWNNEDVFGSELNFMNIYCTPATAVIVYDYILTNNSPATREKYASEWRDKYCPTYDGDLYDGMLSTVKHNTILDYLPDSFIVIMTPGDPDYIGDM